MRAFKLLRPESTEVLKRYVSHGAQYALAFLKWIIAGLTIGVIGGLLGAAFHLSVEYLAGVRVAHPFVLYFLPLGGLLIALMYRLSKVNPSVNDVLETVRTSEKLHVLMIPLIFISTIITQFLGGSAGKEGAAVQMGGAAGYQLGRLMRVNDKDSPIFVMCGMSAVFAAVFGTPITASVFAIEMISVGIMYYSALIPCITAALVGWQTASLLGVTLVKLPELPVTEMSFSAVGWTVLTAVCCAFISVVYCAGLHRGKSLAKKYIKNPYVRVALGGVVIVLLTLIVGNQDYNGAGMSYVARAVSGDAAPYAFLLKIIFTVITMSAGYKGGEIVPGLFIGASLGCFIGSFSSISPGFCAALGVVALFCGMVNCPVASVFLGIEMFGANGLVFYAITAGISFLLSGSYGLYSKQKLVYSKLRAEYINIHAK